MRIGQGIDVHAFQSGGRLVLGGIEIPFDRSLKAHSDGDVLVHALCDAMLGAAALGDIGRHFPDTDPAYAGIASLTLLRLVKDRVGERGLTLVNADLTLVAQAPRLAPWLPAMEKSLAGALSVDSSCISVKATTTEHLGFVGREEGIAAFAVVLLDTG